MHDSIVETILSFDTSSIAEDRVEELTHLAKYISQALSTNGEVALNFICTHNSRRSHLSQIWAQTCAQYFSLAGVYCYSGGTEATAIYPMVKEVLVEQGFDIHTLSMGDNPIYAVRYDTTSSPIIAFSKRYDHIYNAASSYGAVMTCASADEGCPVVIGAEARFTIRYDDPKISDGTEYQKITYLDRSTQIGTEMLYLFVKVATSV